MEDTNNKFIIPKEIWVLPSVIEALLKGNPYFNDGTLYLKDEVRYIREDEVKAMLDKAYDRYSQLFNRVDLFLSGRIEQDDILKSDF